MDQLIQHVKCVRETKTVKVVRVIYDLNSDTDTLEISSVKKATFSLDGLEDQVKSLSTEHQRAVVNEFEKNSQLGMERLILTHCACMRNHTPKFRECEGKLHSVFLPCFDSEFSIEWV